VTRSLTRAARLAIGWASLTLLAGCTAGATPAPSATPTAALASPAASSRPSVPASSSPSPIEDWFAAPEQPAVSGVQYQDVAWTGGRFVAIGAALDGGSVFLDSPDGRTWHRQGALTPESYPGRLAVGPLGVVAVGDVAGRPASWVSSDGLSWTVAPDAFPGSPAGTDTVSVTDVVATDGGWLAVGRIDPACNVNCGSEPIRALVWTSSDGLRWTPIGGQVSFDGGGMAAVTRGGPGYVAAGSADGHAAIWTSTDGAAWSRIPDSPMFGPVTDPAFPVAVFGVAAQEDVVVAVGMDMSDGGGSVLAWWSADGQSWSEATVERSLHGQVFDVAATPEGFLATGPSGEPSCLGGIWASSAGRVWQCVASDPSLAGFGPYAAASSSLVEVVVGLTSAGHDEGSPLGLPGAVWWRPLHSADGADASQSQASQPPSSPAPCVSGSNVIKGDARGEPDDLLSFAQGSANGVVAGDRFQFGRSGSGRSEVRILRGGQEIGRLSFDQDPNGGWLLSEWTLCAGLWVAGPPDWCVMGACGRANLDPLAAPVGALVRVEAENGYFGIWTPAQWIEWCGELSIALHRDEDRAPAQGTLAPLTLVDARTATFRVPELAEGVYHPALSCSGDEAFAWPTLPIEFSVLSGSR
jgi:hypothetical protein